MTRINKYTRAILRIDGRFHIEISRTAPPPMASAALVIMIYPITDGEVWDDPYEVLWVDEGKIIELESRTKE